MKTRKKVYRHDPYMHASINRRLTHPPEVAPSLNLKQVKSSVGEVRADDAMQAPLAVSIDDAP